MRIAVAMSGGIDSSVVAYLLKEKKYDITGITMIPFSNKKYGFKKGEAIESALEDAKKVCDFLNIEHITLNLEKKFESIVVQNFFNEYQFGRTPNPCTLCNQTIKWGAMLDSIIDIGFEKMATGHYNEIVFQNGKYSILRGKDRKKDQSYMLWGLNQYQLSKTIFPIASMQKEEIKKIAKDNNLPTTGKKESQEICFIKRHYSDLLKKKYKIEKGNIILKNEIIGQHQGFQFYTVGQRKGLNTPWKKPLYVKKVNYFDNIIEVTDNPEELSKNCFFIKNVNWISGNFPEYKNLMVQIRYNSSPIEVKSLERYGRKYKVVLKKSVRAISLGQSAVFYFDDLLIGGGEICE